MNNNKIKMKRHESFSIREGWLVKGINAVSENNKIFSDSNATETLGIGTNMVKSLKYWLLATNIMKDSIKNYELTEFGELLKRYDHYLDDVFSWWMIHVHLALNINEFYILNLFFNRCSMKNFSKENIYDIVESDLNYKKIPFSSKVLQDEINVILKTYTIDDKIDNPENNFVCPLSSLELIKKIGKDLYERNKPSIKKLNYLVVYYLLINVLHDEVSINIDEFLKIENGPGKILNFDKNLLYEYLDEMKRNELITINRTAGLNMIYLRRKMTTSEIFEEYFNRGVK